MLEFELDRLINNTYPCECTGSPYVSSHHGHIITGNLSIINNDALKELILKGPKYREPKKIAWGTDKKIIMEAIENYSKSWANKENTTVSVLDDWVAEIRNIINNKIKRLQKQTKQPPDPILQNPAVQACLNTLHEKYVFAPADKAANNVIIICKHFYLN